MNLYFLLEGKRTEPKIYPKWLQVLLPNHTRVYNAYSISSSASDNYYLISGMGFPALLHNQLKNSIDEVNEIGHFSHLIIVLDSEEESIEQRINEVENFIIDQNLNLSCNLKIIVQHRCIETWLLGNRKVFPRQPADTTLVNYINHYSVLNYNPEECPKFPGFNTTAAYHFDYLRAMLKERNVSYTKTNPRAVDDATYLKELIKRSNNGHLISFKTFVDFCKSVR